MQRKSKQTKLRNLIDRLIKKHGREIMEDFQKLHTQPFWNLVDLGNKYGFSREWARQLYKRLYGKGYGKIKGHKTKKMHSEDLACKNNPLYKIAEHKKSSFTRQGAIIEQRFIEECKKYGIDVDIPCNSLVDFRVNGYKVDVKSRSKPHKPDGGKTCIFQYSIRPAQFKKANFFACYHNTEDTFFIIPKDKVFVSDLNQGSHFSITILERKSNYCNARNRYWEYKNAWYLLCHSEP